MGLSPTSDEFLFAYVHVLNTTGDNAAHVYSYNKYCKRALANASRHVFAFAQKYYYRVL